MKFQLRAAQGGSLLGLERRGGSCSSSMEKVFLILFHYSMHHPSGGGPGAGGPGACLAEPGAPGSGRGRARSALGVDPLENVCRVSYGTCPESPWPSPTQLGNFQNEGGGGPVRTGKQGKGADTTLAGTGVPGCRPGPRPVSPWVSTPLKTASRRVQSAVRRVTRVPAANVKLCHTRHHSGGGPGAG